MTAAPRYATRRDPSRRTFGPAAGRLAAALGKPLMPWQQDVADVALEVLADGTWAYRTVVLTVQRQAGKTTLLAPVMLHRCATRPRVKAWLTAQSRQDARDTWLDVAGMVKASPASVLFDDRLSNGSEALTCGATGSTFRVFAPTEDALHGKANELVAVDEVWAFDAAQGAALEQAILPTFTTTGGQLWLVSTAGHARSHWLRRHVDAGRAAVSAGRQDGLAYFEWALDPAKVNTVTAGVGPDVTPAARQAALAALAADHPAAGITLRLDALSGALDTMGAAEVLRAYGNVWTAAAEQAIPQHLWDACAAGDGWSPPEPGRLALAFDVAPDRRDAAVLAAWREDDASPLRVTVIDHHEGTSWVVGRLRELERRWRPQAVAFDPMGPAVDVADELERGGMTLRPVTTREYVTACASFMAGVTHAGRLEHRHDAALDAAVAAAATRPLGDGGWAWSRRHSADSIAALVAATVAAYAYEHRPTPPPRPVVASRPAVSRRL